MKKLKVKNLSPAAALIVAAVAILFAVPIRTFQLVSLIDSGTGFWIDKDKTVPVFYAICLVSVIIIFILVRLSAIMPKAKFRIERDIPMGLASCFLALALALETYTALMGAQTQYKAIDTYESVAPQLFSRGVIFQGLEAVFAVLAMIYFIFVGVSKLVGSGAYQNRRLLALTPSLWIVCRLLIHFIDPIAYKNVSQLLLEIVCLVFALIFFFAFARVAGSVNAENSMWVLFFTGLTTVILGCVTSLAPLMVTLTGRGSYLSDTYPAHFADFAIAVFALLTVYSVLPLTAKVNSLDELEEEEAPDVPEELENPKEHAKKQRKAERAEKKAAKEKAKAEKKAAKKPAEELDIAADAGALSEDTADSAEEPVKSQHDIEMEAALAQAKANAEAAAAKRHRSVYIQDGPYKADAPIPTVYEED